MALGDWTYTDAYSFLGGKGVAEDFDIDRFMSTTSPDDDVETLNKAAAALVVRSWPPNDTSLMTSADWVH